jgi:Glycosyltransferase WbsX
MITSAMKSALLSILLLAAPSVSIRAEESRPLVGAIRWDAWYSDKGPVKEVERSLGPPKYHFRLPWFAQLKGGDQVSINGDSEAIMRQELDYAATAGLDYWAFLDYGPGSDMTHAFDRYLAAADKRGLRFCFIEEGGQIDGRGPKDWPRVIEHFKNPHYLRVLNGRPLLCVFARPKKYGREVFDELRKLTTAAGLPEPYLVLMGWNPAEEREKLGFDAVSEYAAVGTGYSPKPVAYEQLVSKHVAQELWQKWEHDHTPCITFATAGWDTRPRQERPPTWCRWIKAEPDLTPPEQQKPLRDAVTAKPEQIAKHVQEAVQWTRTHRDLNPANCVIIYGWNENDEGGWLVPTLGDDGKPDDSRIQALGKVLRPR